MTARAPEGMAGDGGPGPHKGRAPRPGSWRDLARRVLEPRVRRWWAGRAGVPGRVISLLAWPLEALYRGIVSLRNAAFDRGLLESHRVGAPVVSVGNLVVGGTGKTPVAAWIAARLRERGHRPALVARGYGEDELRLHRRWNPGIPLHAHPDRVAAAAAAVEAGADVVVLDDAFQHRRLARDLDLVLVAAEQPLPGRSLPRGPYREAAASLDRADAVLVTHRTAPPEQVERVVDRVRELAPTALVGRVALRPSGWRRLDGSETEAPPAPVLVVTSVADPESVRALVASQLRATGDLPEDGDPGDIGPGGVDEARLRDARAGEPELLAFPDHHDYGVEDAHEIGHVAAGRIVVTTEKDAVKLEALAPRLPEVRVLVLEVEPGRGTSEVLQRVRMAIRAGPTAPDARATSTTESGGAP